jgi:hypothetical protein
MDDGSRMERQRHQGRLRTLQHYQVMTITVELKSVRMDVCVCGIEVILNFH